MLLRKQDAALAVLKMMPMIFLFHQNDFFISLR